MMAVGHAHESGRSIAGVERVRRSFDIRVDVSQHDREESDDDAIDRELRVYRSGMISWR